MELEILNQMYPQMLVSSIFAALFPVLFFAIIGLIKNTRWQNRLKISTLVLYTFLILYLTVINRPTREREGNITPFWTYAYFYDIQFRWQIYMNVLLFVPLGFLLPFSAKLPFLWSILVGCLFSVGIEAVQYFGNLGFCEFDDVFHNTSGTVLGYLYFLLLRRISKLWVKNE